MIRPVCLKIWKNRVRPKTGQSLIDIFTLAMSSIDRLNASQCKIIAGKNLNQMQRTRHGVRINKWPYMSKAAQLVYRAHSCKRACTHPSRADTVKGRAGAFDLSSH